MRCLLLLFSVFAFASFGVLCDGEYVLAQKGCDTGCTTFKADSVTLQLDPKSQKITAYQFKDDCIGIFRNDFDANKMLPAGSKMNQWRPVVATAVCQALAAKLGTSVLVIPGQAKNPTDSQPYEPVTCKEKCTKCG